MRGTNFIIQAREVTKEYHGATHALDSVSLDIAEGEWVAVMGPWGSEARRRYSIC